MDIDYQDVFRAGDVDNDNDIDMILWDQSSATMSYSRNDGFGNFVLHQDIPMSTTPNISLSDIDSDGRLEMVLMNDTLGARIYRLDDLGFFTPGPFIIAASASDQVRPYDVDEDGDMDLLMLCIGLDGVHRISWLEHQDCTAFPQAAITWAGGNILQASAGSSYQWLLNGIPMPEAIEQDVSVPVNGSYEVIVTNDFGCTDTSEVFEVVALGFPEYEEPFLRVIPNPASDGIRVFCDQPLTPDMRIEIMDLNGRTVRTLWGSGDQGLFIPRYGLSPGLYGVRILRDLSPVAFVSVVFE